MQAYIKINILFGRVDTKNNHNWKKYLSISIIKIIFFAFKIFNLILNTDLNMSFKTFVRTIYECLNCFP